MAGEQGFEPQLTVLETASLPLTDSPILVPRAGIEPATHRLMVLEMRLELISLTNRLVSYEQNS